MTSSLSLVVLVALAGLASAQFGQGQFGQGQFNQGQFGQGQFGQGQFNQGQSNQGQFRQDQFNQAAVSRPAARQSLQPRQVVEILYDERDGPDASGAYSFRFETADGTKREESGTPTGLDNYEIRGSYTYRAPDGTDVEVTYVADENGYRPESPFLPVPPPMPAHSLAQVARAEEEFARQRQGQQSFPQTQSLQGQQNFQQDFQGQSFRQDQGFQGQNFQQDQGFQGQNFQQDQGFQGQNFRQDQGFQGQGFQQNQGFRQGQSFPSFTPNLRSG